VKERLFLDRIALDAGDVSPRDAQHPLIVVADFADADGAGWYRAIVSAGVTAEPAFVETFVDISLTSAGVQHLAQGSHD
jgi:hypothetical protein